MTHDDTHDNDASTHESDAVEDGNEVNERTTGQAEPVASMGRRDYLRGVAAAAAAAGLGTA
ncbi:Fibronectin type III domain protein, partial [Halorhabdus tiamatea SARL4B]